MFLLVASLMFGSLTPETTYSLIAQAMDAQTRAYAPYSKYKVGAAVVTHKGKVYTGCNVENASYGLTICAERVAVFKAVSENGGMIDGIAIVTLDGGFPCGACLQVLSEFNPTMYVIIANKDGIIKSSNRIDYYFPKPFSSEKLQIKNDSDSE